MAVDVLPNPTSGTAPANTAEPSATALVSGIVKDAQELLTQQINLFKVEAQQELRQTTQAAISLGIGLATALVGAILLAMTCVHLLAYLFPTQPIWIWYGLVGLVIAAIGGFVVAGALQAFNKIHALPETQEAIKETLEWQTRPK